MNFLPEKTKTKLRTTAGLFFVSIFTLQGCGFLHSIGKSADGLNRTESKIKKNHAAHAQSSFNSEALNLLGAQFGVSVSTSVSSSSSTSSSLQFNSAMFAGEKFCKPAHWISGNVLFPDNFPILIPSTLSSRIGLLKATTLKLTFKSKADGRTPPTIPVIPKPFVSPQCT
jgi:hypothetical protein